MAEYVIKPKITIRLTQDDIDDIVCCALEGGCTYWCNRVDVVGGKYLGEWAHEQISRGGKLRFRDCETDQKWVLTLPKLLKGIRMWVEQGHDEWGVVDGYMIDTCMVDADIADQIIQLSLFNDVVFG